MGSLTPDLHYKNPVTGFLLQVFNNKNHVIPGRWCAYFSFSRIEFESAHPRNSEGETPACAAGVPRHAARSAEASDGTADLRRVSWTYRH